MSYIIQNMSTEKYVKHNGSTESYPFVDVDRPDAAEQYTSLAHAKYVASWYLDTFEKWRIVDCQEGKSYMREQDRWVVEDRIPQEKRAKRIDFILQCSIEVTREQLVAMTNAQLDQFYKEKVIEQQPYWAAE